MGRRPLPTDQKAPHRAGKPRLPTGAETAEVASLVASLRVELALSPAACGRSRLSVEGVLEAPQVVVAEMARIAPGDLSALLNGRRPSGISVATALERIRDLQKLQEGGVLEVASEAGARPWSPSRAPKGP